MNDTVYNEAPYLLTRKNAAQRYGMSVRGLEEMYKRHPEFPIVRVGRKVLIHRDKADAFFTSYVLDVVETE